MRMIVHALLLAPALALAETPADYAYSAPIAVSAATPFQRVELPATVYRVLTHGDLRDLRVFNAAGEVVPHAIELRQSAKIEKAAMIDVPLFALPQAASDSGSLSVQVEKRGDGTIVSVLRDAPANTSDAPHAYLIDASRLERTVGALDLVPADASAQFIGRMRVEASDDLEHWRTLAGNAPLLVTHANGQTLSRLRIEWPATAAKYWRASWVGGSSAQGVVSFTRAVLEPAASTREPARIWQRVEPLRVGGNQGEYVYEPPVGAPIDRLRLHLPQPNSVVPVTLLTRSRSEDPWRTIGNHTVYRLQQDGIDFANPDIAVGSMRELLLRIDNRGGGLGSGAPILEIGWTPHTLVFAARGAGPYRLVYGRAQATAAAYPIQSLVPDYGDGSSDAVRKLIGTAALGETTTAGGEAQLRPQVDFKRWTLWGVLLAAVLLLGAMAWRLWRQMGTRGPDSDSEHR
ncbi:MAG: DUF3999 domain-containing protein [Sterolibacteriaceae bacterium]|nr:DUF3999 domain-containing protein [Sterolibacteriaceae bacterium]MBK9086901.1 DUF3999 domain-containing protein [Sterolibacteriaceae bacterium]